MKYIHSLPCILLFSALAAVPLAAQTPTPEPTPLQRVYDFGGQSRGMISTADGRYLYISDAKSALVSRIDLEAFDRADVVVSGNPGRLALSPDESTLYVAQSGATTMAVVDTISFTGAVIWDLNGNVPVDIAATKDRVYIAANSGHDAVLLIVNALDGSVITTHEQDWDSNTGLIEVDRVRKKLYSGVVGWSPSNLTRWDISTDTPVFETQCDHGALGSNGKNLTLSPDGLHLLFMVGGGNGGYVVYYIRALSDKLASRDGEFDIGTYPLDMAYYPCDSRVYGICGSSSDKDIKVLDTDTQLLLGTLTPDYVYPGEDPLKLCVSGDGAYLVLYAEETYYDYDGHLYIFGVDPCPPTPTPTPEPTITPTKTPPVQPTVDPTAKPPTQAPSAPKPTTTPEPPSGLMTEVNGEQFKPGDLISFDVSLTIPVWTSTDVYILVETPRGIFSIGLDGSITRGRVAAAANVPRIDAPVRVNILKDYPCPQGISGTITFYVVLVKAGRFPPVSGPSELTHSSQHVITLDRVSIQIR